MPPKATPNSGTEHGVNVLPIGTHLGEFEVVDLIGEGGFGIVYLAYDHSLERHVAVKEYMPSGLATRTPKMSVTVRSQHNAGTFTAGLKSFINEAKLLAQFDSPSLVKVHRFWEGNGTAYMVMPYYEGITLKQALKERRIVPNEGWIRLLLADLFDAIETIHRVQCLHRDIAPDNILLLKDGRPLLLDFGAARRVIGDLTQCLTVILKPGFAPIEQYADIAGLRQGAWTDIYALAAVVYYLITGRAPPPAVARIVHDDIVPAREAGKGRYSNAFLAVIDKALSVKPEQRYQSISELRHALDLMETVPRPMPRTGPLRTTRTAPTIRMDDSYESTEEFETRTRLHPDLQSSSPQHSYQTEWPDSQRADHRPSTRDDERASMRSASKATATRLADQRFGESRPTGATTASIRRGMPAWAVPALLLSAGIAAGAYWSMRHTVNAPSDQTAVASMQAPHYETSGASEVPDQEAADTSSAQAPSPSLPPAVTHAPPAPETPAGSAASEPSPQARPQAAMRPADTNTSSLPPSQEVVKPRPNDQPTAAVPPRLSREDELWQSANASNKPSAYKRYLKAYPKGRYAEIARLRLESEQTKTAMEAQQPAQSPSATQETKPQKAAEAAPKETQNTAQASPEEELWNTARTINEAPAYEAYLHKYPNGRFAPVAKDFLASAKQSQPPQPAVPAVTKSEATESGSERKPAAQTDKQTSIKPVEPGTGMSTPAPRKQAPAENRATPDNPAAAPEAPVASEKRSLKLDNQTMIGDFSVDPKNGKVSGTGKIVWNDGNQFEGTLVRGVKEGKGRFTWANGQRYSGDWAHDMPNGKGTIIFANGNRYTGDVKDGIPHGQGVLHFKDGDVYNGAWVKGKSQGNGRYTWANGSYWEGEFKDDKRTENGKMVFAGSANKAPANAEASGQDEPHSTNASASGN